MLPLEQPDGASGEDVRLRYSHDFGDYDSDRPRRQIESDGIMHSIPLSLVANGRAFLPLRDRNKNAIVRLLCCLKDFRRDAKRFDGSAVTLLDRGSIAGTASCWV